jgi:hypothetical protein
MDILYRNYSVYLFLYIYFIDYIIMSSPTLYKHDENDEYKTEIYNLLFTNYGKNIINWIRVKTEKDHVLFYDILFDLLHDYYNYRLNKGIYTNDYIGIDGKTFLKSLPINFIFFYQNLFTNDSTIRRSTALSNLSSITEEHTDSESVYDSDENQENIIFQDTTEILPKDELKKYLFQKLNITDYEKYVRIKLTLKDIEEYVYFKSMPDILYKIKFYDQNQKKSLKLEINDFYWDYFIWRKKGDPILQTPSLTEKITANNYYKYRVLLNHGWKNEQLITFFKNVMIPEFLKQSNLNININHPIYAECLRNILSNSKYLNANIISQFINGKKLNSETLKIIDMVILKKDKKTTVFKIYSSLEKISYYQQLTMNDIYRTIYKMIICLKYNQKMIRLYLSEKIQRIKLKYAKNAKLRFKWQLMCKELTKKVDINTLRELALLENINNATMMTKRELCKAFSEKLEDMIKNAKEIKCTNDVSYLTGENITSISPEFLISYQHKNKVYCDDIRALKTQIDTNDNMHPAFREKLTNETIDKINNKYIKLLKTTTTLDDFDEQKIDLSPLSLLQSQMTNLILKTHGSGYIKTQDLFINSDEELFNKFMESLFKNYLLSQNEKSYIKKFKNLIDKKAKLVELIILKIDNDPNKSGDISEIANNFINIYNDVF